MGNNIPWDQYRWRNSEVWPPENTEMTTFSATGQSSGSAKTM